MADRRKWGERRRVDFIEPTKKVIMRNDLTKFNGFRAFESLEQQMANIVQFRQTFKMM